MLSLFAFPCQFFCNLCYLFLKLEPTEIYLEDEFERIATFPTAGGMFDCSKFVNRTTLRVCGGGESTAGPSTPSISNPENAAILSPSALGLSSAPKRCSQFGQKSLGIIKNKDTVKRTVLCSLHMRY